MNAAWTDWLRRRLLDPLPNRASKTRVEPTPSLWEEYRQTACDAARQPE